MVLPGLHVVLTGCGDMWYSLVDMWYSLDDMWYLLVVVTCGRVVCTSPPWYPAGWRLPSCRFLKNNQVITHTRIHKEGSVTAHGRRSVHHEDLVPNEYISKLVHFYRNCFTDLSRPMVADFLDTF